ncbi:MAG: phage cell wall peptidase [Beijerinckiaceae bacterium]|nr:MAG: phage cell wall peptidase [Beijerinckiaceae bacterium]
MSDQVSARRQLRREDIVVAARRWIGTPYQHQASLKGVGCDCLGLLRGVWRDVLGEEPEEPGPYSPAWAELSEGDPLLAAAARHLVPVETQDLLTGSARQIRPGMVLVFRWRANSAAKHCGIATGEGRFIHAHDGASVAEVAIVPGWRRRIVGLFDYPEVVD